MPTTIAIIVAAGSGTRFGSAVPKQFLTLGGKPVLMHTIEAFRQALPEGEILLVLSPEMIPYWEELCREHTMQSPTVVAGGASRWESVKNAVDSIPTHTGGAATVLVHDGARPLVPPGLIRRVVKYARNTDGAIPAVELADSLRELDGEGGEMASHPVNRTRFRAVQTPQAFALWRMREAYSLPWQESFTDDASVMAAAEFHNVVLCPGSRRNIKITTAADLLLAEMLLAHPEIE